MVRNRSSPSPPLLTWGWCSISYTTKLEQKVNLLEERVRRYRWECERLELEKQLKRERAR